MTAELDDDRRTPPASAPGPLDRLLRVFTDVRPGESGTVLLLFLNLFLLFTGYYIIKTAREPLILVSGGAELRAYASAVMAVVLMGFVPLYSWFSSRVDRLKMIFGVILFFVVNIELFYLGAHAQVPKLGFLFFVWVGIYNNAMVALFWSFANDLYRREAGERLFPVIFLGATLGAPVGAKIAEVLFDLKVKPFDMMQISVGLLIVNLALYWVVNRREAARPGQAQASASALAAGPGGFGLVFRSRYLTLFAALILLLNLVNTTGEYILSRTLVAAARQAAAVDPSVDVTAFIGSFSGSYQFYASVATAILQAFVVSRIVKYFGLAGALLALPLVAFGSYTLMAAGAGLALIRWAKVAENATDYSLTNTGKQLVWLPTTREEKYKAKQAVDTFFVRFGDLVQAAVVFVGTAWLGFGARAFAVTNLGFIAVWLVVALALLREHRRIVQRQEETAKAVA
ncbi:MAG TPA: Npt1/Npt2 family nucleotide transporter [Vicinamibacteria bacterium]|nr:Npt1/Npt2 family nucleotide transporter [Vicinamibacteria bacterium]